MVKMKNDELEFDEETHTYTVKGKKLESVTEFVSRFFPAFDKEKVSERVASKRGVTKEEVLEEWEAIADAGTMIHEEIENWINVRLRPIDDKAKRGVDWLILSGYREAYPMMTSEKRIYSEQYGLAGTIDLLFIKSDDYTKSRAVLVDWKTNENLTTQNRYELTSSEGPISHLHNSKLNKYVLQLSTYAYILEEEYDVIIDELVIVQLKEDRFVEIKVDYLRNVVKNMLREKLLEEWEDGV